MVKLIKAVPGTELESLALEDFARSPATHAKAIKASRRPRALTVKGRGGLVVLDEKEYRRLAEHSEAGATEQKLRRGMAQSLRQDGVPAREALNTLRQEHARKG